MDDLANDAVLSVVIPNHNYGEFIGAAIASINAQTYGPIELIVVDDASTDNSVEVIEEALAAAGNVRSKRLIVLERNVGKLGALNRALEHVTGRYFIILDSDDILLPDYAARTIAELERAREDDETIAFIYTDCMLISRTGQELDRGKSTAWDKALLERYSFVPEPATCLAAPVFEAAPYDSAIRKGTKHHKWKKIVADGWNGRHLAEPLFCYRMHQGNLSGIGKRVIDEVERGERGERILSGYWPLQSTGH
ncbi:glycosyltransferase family 2 protein [Altererythrobacter sp. Root672]|uniref:glycosyltransferase family 2 protein n=1 Tax=Altererythrobacter sp. Root672 TaxID=1736584 RepID=UPI00070082AC|nr:glycosyltransferase family 2 protein [Altererythrobacter sp. Root672]KRA84496.1 hypothetical protein ASD76_11125 [Altererythrobacter sp. Root672]